MTDSASASGARIVCQTRPGRQEACGLSEENSGSPAKPKGRPMRPRTAANGRLEGAVAVLGQVANEFFARVWGLDERLTAITEELQRIRVDDAVLSDMHEQCRVLREQFHEREVLEPVFRALIGLADRCRREIDEFTEPGDEFGNSEPPQAARTSGRLAEARSADLTEIEAVLAVFGVEPFCRTGARFDPATQKCVRRIPTSDGLLHGRVERSKLPGYRRGARVIRPEYVSAFVADSHDSPPTLQRRQP